MFKYNRLGFVPLYLGKSLLRLGVVVSLMCKVYLFDLVILRKKYE